MMSLRKHLSALRAQLAYAKRWALYSRYYTNLASQISAKEAMVYFNLPPVIDKRTGSVYLRGKHCYYYQNSFAEISNAILADCEFRGCIGAWATPLIWIKDRGFTAEPQLSSPRAAMKFGRPNPVSTLTDRRLINGEAFHLLGPYESNWYHSLVDQFSLIARWEAFGLRERGVRLVMPKFWHRRWPELVELAGLAEREIVWFDGKPIEVEHLLVPLGARVREVSRTPASEVSQTFANPNDLRALRQLFLKRLETSPRGARDGRVIISRGDARKTPRTRHFHNLAEKLARGYGFETIVMGDLSPSQQLKVFRDSQIVVAEHGASLAGLVTASEETVVLEVLPEDQSDISPHSFNFIAACLGHRAYYPVVDAPVAEVLPYIETLLERGEAPSGKALDQ